MGKAEKLVDILRKRRQTVATAESCTGGGVGALITAVPGASECYLGGVIAYANAVKTTLLGVSERLLSVHGAVSEACAEAMAAGAAARLGAFAAIATTGIAGPGGGSAAKPVGTVCIGVCAGRRRRTVTEHFDGDRATVRRQAAERGLELLTELLEGGGDDGVV